MKILLILMMAAGLPACAEPAPQSAPQAFGAVPKPLWAASPPAPPYPQSRDRSRLPLPGDSGFAWDTLSHWGDVRWECRAVPSGQFVKQSFCKDLPRQIREPKPASFSSTEGWDGMLHDD